MSFLDKNFSPIGGQAKAGNSPAQWSYSSSTDNLAAILASDYFNEIATRVQAGDFINIIGTDGSAIATILTVIVTPAIKSVELDPDVILPISPAENRNSTLAFGATAISSSATNVFLNRYTAAAPGVATAVLGEIIASRNGTLKNLVVRQGVAGGGALQLIIYSVFVDGVEASPMLRVLLAASSVGQAFDPDAVEVPITAGQRISIQAENVGPVATPKEITASLTFM